MWTCKEGVGGAHITDDTTDNKTVMRKRGSALFKLSDVSKSE
ncbi:MAG TPA: hypothetical protein PK604_10815 [Acetivibrio clariflavus]|nr:hypothetical protein [Acetivibrio clariflavus]